MQSLKGGNVMWKLFTLKYAWPVQKYQGGHQPPMVTLFTSRWYPLSLFVFLTLKVTPGPKIITLHNEVYP